MEEWSRVNIQGVLKPSVKFLQSDDVEGHVVCWQLVHCVLSRPKSTQALNQEVLEHVMLPPKDKLHGEAERDFFHNTLNS